MIVIHTCIGMNEPRSRAAGYATLFRIKDKVIVVIGASRGIGLEIARLLSQNGAKVVFAGRTIERLQEEAGKTGPENLAVQMDIIDSTSIERAVSEIHNRYGRIDVLVNNAGQNGQLGYWSDMNPSLEREVFETHVFGTLNTIRAQNTLHRYSTAIRPGFRIP
jgi:NADP-dependent 3-hydroxy acid dehydrogenase YdfG